MDRFDESFHLCPIDGSDESNDWTNIYSLPLPYERTKTYSPILPFVSDGYIDSTNLSIRVRIRRIKPFVFDGPNQTCSNQFPPLLRHEIHESYRWSRFDSIGQPSECYTCISTDISPTLAIEKTNCGLLCKFFADEYLIRWN